MQDVVEIIEVHNAKKFGVCWYVAGLGLLTPAIPNGGAYEVKQGGLTRAGKFAMRCVSGWFCVAEQSRHPQGRYMYDPHRYLIRCLAENTLHTGGNDNNDALSALALRACESPPSASVLGTWYWL